MNHGTYIKTLKHARTLTFMNVHTSLNEQLQRTQPVNLDIDEITALPLKEQCRPIMDLYPTPRSVFKSLKLS